MTETVDLVASIMEYESGEMSDEDEVEFFQYLIDTGLAWQLQGHYGRTAVAYLNAGICHNGGALQR